MYPIISFILTLLISAAVIWVAQKAVLPKEKERGFSSVLVLALVWAIVEAVLYYIFSLTPFGAFEKLFTLIIWIWLLKSWFKVGWLQASVISLLAWILMLIAGFIIGIFALSLSGPGVAPLSV